MLRAIYFHSLERLRQMRHHRRIIMRNALFCVFTNANDWYILFQSSDRVIIAGTGRRAPSAHFWIYPRQFSPRKKKHSPLGAFFSLFQHMQIIKSSKQKSVRHNTLNLAPILPYLYTPAHAVPTQKPRTVRVTRHAYMRGNFVLVLVQATAIEESKVGNGTRNRQYQFWPREIHCSLVTPHYVGHFLGTLLSITLLRYIILVQPAGVFRGQYIGMTSLRCDSAIPAIPPQCGRRPPRATTVRSGSAAAITQVAKHRVSTK
jgi:hypothetical protein